MILYFVKNEPLWTVHVDSPTNPPVVNLNPMSAGLGLYELIPAGLFSTFSRGVDLILKGEVKTSCFKLIHETEED